MIASESASQAEDGLAGLILDIRRIYQGVVAARHIDRRHPGDGLLKRDKILIRNIAPAIVIRTFHLVCELQKRCRCLCHGLPPRCWRRHGRLILMLRHGFTTEGLDQPLRDLSPLHRLGSVLRVHLGIVHAAIE